jgi:Glycosyltransferase family 87
VTWSPTATRWLPALALVAVLTAIATASGKQLRRTATRGDVEVYIHGARLMLAGENIYATPEPRGHQYYLYLPLFAFLVVPLTFVPIQIAVVFWTALSAALAWWIVIQFYHAMTGASFFSLPRKARWVIGFFTIFLTLRALLYHLDIGQANLLVMAVVVFGLRLLAAGRPVAGGIAVGLSIVLKIVALPLSILFVVQGRVRVVAGIACGVAAGLLLPAIVLGFERNLSYVSYWSTDVILAAGDLRSTRYWPLSMNYSLAAQLYRFFGDVVAFEHDGRPYSVTLFELPDAALQLAGKLVPVATALVIAAYAWLYRRRDELTSLWGGAALSFCLAPVFSTLSHKHYFVMLLPAHLYVVHLWYGLNLKDLWFRSLVVMSFVVAILSTTLFDFLGALMSNLGGLIWGAILLAAAIFRAAHVNTRHPGSSAPR